MTQINQYAPDHFSSGQPTREQLRQLAQDGFGTIINLRHPDEPGQFDEKSEAEENGLHYVSIPISSAQDLVPRTVEKFSDELAHAKERGAVLVHCASANRVGALVALEQAWYQGTDTETALALGRAAGLAGLEPAVSSLLARPKA